MRMIREKLGVKSAEDMKKLFESFIDFDGDCEVTMNISGWVIVVTYPHEEREKVDKILFEFDLSDLEGVAYREEHSEC